MSRKPRIPSYRFHKASGQAVVVLNGRSFYLGVFGTPESKAEYQRLIGEWLANQRRPLPVVNATDVGSPGSESFPVTRDLTVTELCVAYWQHAKQYYVKDGEPTSEQDTIRQALRFLRQLHGHTPAREFGPLALKAVRDAMVKHPVTCNVKVKDAESGQVSEEGIKPDEFVFSPRRAEMARLTLRRQERGLSGPVVLKDRGKWTVWDYDDKDSYRRAIRRACLKLGIPIWFPLQLRHSTGTLIRRTYGLEASQAVLGHAELAATQVYSEVDLQAARKIMAEIG